MTILSTYFSGTPARPHAHEIQCLRINHGHIHIEATGISVALGILGANGNNASVDMSPADARQLSVILQEALHRRLPRIADATLRADEAEERAA